MSPTRDIIPYVVPVLVYFSPKIYIMERGLLSHLKSQFVTEFDCCVSFKEMVKSNKYGSCA